MNKIIYNTGSHRALTKAIIDNIHQAKHWLKACNLFFDDQEIKQALLEAASRGVAIFVLTNLQGVSSAKRKDKKSGKTKEDAQNVQSFAHAQVLSELYSAGAHISGLDGLHAKFLLSDTGQGLITSANFTHNSIEKISEIGVEVSGRDFNDLERLFDLIFIRPDKYHFSNNDTNYSYERPTDPIDSGILTYGENLRMTLAHSARGGGYALQNCNCYDLRNEIFEIINSAKSGEDLYIATYSLEADAKGPDGITLYEALLNAKERNVRLHILMREEKKKKLKGIYIYYHSDNHAKAVLTKERGIILTGNLTNESFHSGFDIGLKLYPQQIQATKNFIEKLINDTKR